MIHATIIDIPGKPQLDCNHLPNYSRRPLLEEKGKCSLGCKADRSLSSVSNLSLSAQDPTSAKFFGERCETLAKSTVSHQSPRDISAVICLVEEHIFSVSTGNCVLLRTVFRYTVLSAKLQPNVCYMISTSVVEVHLLPEFCTDLITALTHL